MRKAMMTIVLVCVFVAGIAFAAQAQVQSSITSTYMSIGGYPVTLQSPVTLYNDGTTLRIDMPGAYLGASDGGYYDKFMSFSFSMPAADWLLFLTGL